MTRPHPRASGGEVACCSFGAVALVGAAVAVVLLRVAEGASAPSFEDGLLFLFALGSAVVVGGVGALGALVALVVHLVRHGPVLRPVTWVLGLLPALAGAAIAVGLLLQQ